LVILGGEKDARKPKTIEDCCTIRLIPIIAENTFAAKNLSPHINNLSNGLQSGEGNVSDADGANSAFYNQSILEDMQMVQHLKMIHASLKLCPNATNAILLLKTWLRQRQLDQYFCFNGFHFSLFLAHLIAEKAVNKYMSVYQIFKILLDRFLKTSWEHQTPFRLTQELSSLVGLDVSPSNAERTSPSFSSFPDSDVVFLSPDGRLNIALHVYQPAFQELISEAKHCISLLQAVESSTGNFDSLFLQKIEFIFKYDQFFVIKKFSDGQKTIKIEAGTEQDALEKHLEHIFGASSKDISKPILASKAKKLSSLLQHGLNSRITSIAIRPPPQSEWIKETQSPSILLVGLQLDPIHSFRLIDYGPLADDESAVSIFRLHPLFSFYSLFACVCLTAR